MSGFTPWTGQWPGSVDAIDCDLCGGLFDPPCPFHPDATPVSVLADGFRRYWLALHWTYRHLADARALAQR